MTGTTFFIANRVWWGAALFMAPFMAAVVDSIAVGIGVLLVLVLVAAVVFDTDRGWWSDEVRALPADKDRSRREARLLTLTAGIGLVLGLAAAYALG